MSYVADFAERGLTAMGQEEKPVSCTLVKEFSTLLTPFPGHCSPLRPTRPPLHVHPPDPPLRSRLQRPLPIHRPRTPQSLHKPSPQNPPLHAKRAPTSPHPPHPSPRTSRRLPHHPRLYLPHTPTNRHNLLLLLPLLLHLHIDSINQNPHSLPQTPPRLPPPPLRPPRRSISPARPSATPTSTAGSNLW